MNIKKWNHHWTLEIILVLILLLQCSGARPSPAQAQTLANPESPTGVWPQAALASATPVPGGPGYVIVNAFAFQPYAPHSNYQESKHAFSGITLRNTSTAAYDWFMAPIQLPHGATITKLTLYYMDNDNSEYISIDLDRGPLDGINPVLTMAYVTTNGLSSSSSVRSRSTTTISNSVIDLSSFSYYLELMLPPSANLSFTAARVDYNYPTYLPSVAR